MKRFLLFTAIYLILAQFAQAEDYQYFPFNDGTQIKRIIQNPNNLDEFYIMGISQFLQTFNRKTGELDSFCTISGNTILDIGVDENNVLWILCSNNLFKFENNELVAMDTLFQLSFHNSWSFSKFSKKPNGELFVGIGGYFIKLGTDSESVKAYHLLDDLNLNKRFFNDRVVFMDNYTIMTGQLYEDSLIFIDLNNISDRKVYNFRDYNIPKGAVVNTIKVFDKSVFMSFTRKNPNGGELAISSGMYICENNTIERMSIPYLDTTDYFAYRIEDFIFDDNGNMIMAVQFIDNIKDHLSQILIFNPQHELIKIYDTPILKGDNPASHGEESIFYRPGNLVLTKDGYLHMSSYGDAHSGVLRLNLSPLSVDSDVEVFNFAKTWILNAYPNPVSGKITVDYFCIESEFPNLKLEIYDYVGIKYSGVQYENVEYNTVTGKGKFRVDLTNVPHGSKYLLLKTGTDSDAFGITVQ